MRRHVLLGLALSVVVLLVAGCDAGSSGSSGGVLKVVAAENFWGSIARQLGGTKVSVTSIISNPATDPHDYEPTAKDARNIAGAAYVIENGVGYDGWLGKLVSANHSSGQRVLNIGDLLGLKNGDNPHRWYSPDDVQQVIAQITSDYKLADAADAAYFDQQRTTFERDALAKYSGLVTQIKQRYSGVPVGASESIFTPLAQALGLKLLTPASFLDAISEGSDPTAGDKATCDQQIKEHQIKVYVYNSQNATPDVTAQINEAKAAGIPVVTITETLTPADATFQDWQSAQLQALANALAAATGTPTP
jgi:zinc/manganese transport system substrate-binding protein